MILRFSLYGFLKNQQYYDPFIVLAFLQMGLNFTLIGVLIASREFMVNLLEIPTGAIADVCGRRRSMIMSFVGYIISFAVMGGAGVASMEGWLSLGVLLSFLFPAMAFFAVGEAFRTGTHKAMIFTWLRLQGRTDERTKVYGYTRSWSTIGSAVSVVLASIFVLFTRNFVYVFFFSIVPYVLNLINFFGYPNELEGDISEETSLRRIVTHLREALVLSVRQPSLRRLLFESMGFEGFFKAAKDYLQPVLKAAALPLTAALFAGAALSEEQQSVLLIGPVYLVLFLLSALASRKAHVLVRYHGNEDHAARFLWLVAFLVLAGMVPAMYFGIHWVMIVGFVGLSVLQNLWRPILITRFDSCSDEASGATILSIESQAKSVATMVIAPSLGFAIDTTKAYGVGTSPFWPLAVFGAVVALLFFLSSASGRTARSGWSGSSKRKPSNDKRRLAAVKNS
jgi:MFS family permease